ncbi:MAG: tetratricopeptide repeat protein, partial [Betaproteobacteria bacterium]|nr:tetratricopeptide repeat protein [Betaproteobacteria bacterium]
MLKSGQHQQALERVNKVLAAKPRDARARFLKGLIFAEQGNAKDATDVFVALTKDNPDLPEPYNNLAVIYASQGQYDKALQFDSANPAAKNKLALVRELVGGSPAKPVAVAVASATPVTPAAPAAAATPSAPTAPAAAPTPPKEAAETPVDVTDAAKSAAPKKG